MEAPHVGLPEFIYMFICRHFRNWDELAFSKTFWDPYWGRAIQLLANLIVLCLIAILEVFEKVNSSQFAARC